MTRPPAGCDALGLPGEELLVEGGSDHLTEVLPSARSIQTFNQLITNKTNHHTNLKTINNDR